MLLLIYEITNNFLPVIMKITSKKIPIPHNLMNIFKKKSALNGNIYGLLALECTFQGVLLSTNYLSVFISKLKKNPL